MAQPTEEPQTEPNEEMIISNSTANYKIDYADAKSFEQALNDEIKVHQFSIQTTIMRLQRKGIQGCSHIVRKGVLMIFIGL